MRRGLIIFALILSVISSYTHAHGVPSSYQKECDVIADFANRNQLNQLEEPPPRFLLDSKIEQLLEQADLALQMPQFWQVDLNDDGRQEMLVMDIQGMSYIGYAFVFPYTDTSTSTHHQLLHEGQDLSFLKVNNQYIFVSRIGDYHLASAWIFNRNNQFQPVCYFTQEESPELTQEKNNNPRVCSAVTSNEVSYLNYLPSAAFDAISNISRFETLVDGVTQIDLNNDGKQDNVTRLEYVSSNEHCISTYLRSLNGDQTNIPKNPLNDLLIRELGGCGLFQNAFIYKGVTYIDQREESGNRAIFLIRKNRLKIICSFKGRIINRVNKAL